MRFFLFFLFSLSLYSLHASEVYRYTIFLAGVPVGEATDTWEKTTYNGRCAISLHSTTAISISRGKSTFATTTDSTTVAECDTFYPISIHAISTEGDSKTVIDALVVNGILKGSISRNGVSEPHTLSVPKGTQLFSHIYRAFSDKQFLAGVGKLSILNDETLGLISMTPKAKKVSDGVEVTVAYQGIPISAVIRDGIVRSLSMKNGLITYRIKGSDAPSTRTVAPDMLALSALHNKGISIASPRRAKRVVFTLRGDSIPSIPETCFQKVRRSKDSVTVTVLSTHSCKGTASSSDLAQTIYITSNNPAIQKQSKQLLNASKTTEEFVQKTVSFVFDHITDKSYKHGMLAADEVLKGRSGDCTEHSTLLAALLRAQGIPVKMLYGIVLTKDNRFFFHNWNAVFTGSGWTPVDATMNQIPADAARIVISVGGSTSTSRENVAVSVINFLQGISVSVKEAH